MGLASGWNLCVWLECIDVVVVRMYIDFLIILLIPTRLILALFCSSSIPPVFVHFKNVFNSCIFA